MHRIQINLPFSVHCIITNLKIGNIDTDLHKVKKKKKFRNCQLIDRWPHRKELVDFKIMKSYIVCIPSWSRRALDLRGECCISREICLVPRRPV